MKEITEGGNRRESLIEVKVIFGMPSSSCAGNGVCKMLPYHLSLKEKFTCPVYKGYCEYGVGEIELTLPFDQFSNRECRERFEHRSFHVQERFMLPRWLCKKLGIQESFIAVGSYPVMRKKKTIKLRLSCCPVQASPKQNRKVA